MVNVRPKVTAIGTLIDTGFIIGSIFAPSGYGMLSYR